MKLLDVMKFHLHTQMCWARPFLELQELILGTFVPMGLGMLSRDKKTVLSARTVAHLTYYTVSGECLYQR